MEPCAPGTEDEAPITYASLIKQENEKQRLLNLKAVLKNGKYDNIFELSYVNGAEHWFCKACECPVMGRVFQHENGRRHSLNLAAKNNYTQKESKDEPVGEAELDLDVAPGEPAPPGFEDVAKTCLIQERLDGFKVGPLVALEYLMELQDYDPSKEPVYLCTLCDKRGDPRTVLTHLASYNHLTHYIQKHFPTCYRALAPYMGKQNKRNWQITLQKIAEAIEKKFGRLKPLSVEKDKFDNDKSLYFRMIAKGRHFSESSGYTFEELIVPEELTKVHEDEMSSETPSTWGASNFIEKPFKKRSPSPPVVAMPTKKTKANQPGKIKEKQQSGASYHSTKAVESPAVKGRRRSLSSVSSISSDGLNDIRNKNVKETFNRRLRRSPFQRGRHVRNRSPSPRRRSPSPPFRRGARHREDNRNVEDKAAERNRKTKEMQEEKVKKIEEFRKLARAIENDMHKTLKQHEKNPEKHPQYSEEWKKFWNMRYKQLQSEGVDVAKYDFKPEWIDFWNKRMIELHSDELRKRKDALRKRLGLPEDINPIKYSIGGTGGAPAQIVVTPKPNLPMAAQPDQDNEVIIIEDHSDDRSRRKKSRSPWEKETPSKTRPSRRRPSPSPARRDRSKSRSRERTRNYFRKSLSPPLRESPRSRDGMSDRYAKGVSRSRDYERDHRSFSRERRSPSLERGRDKRDFERKREMRESSFERDLKARERIRTVADLPWEREKHFRDMYYDYYKPPPMMRDISRLPQMVSLDGLPPEEEEDNAEVNVVDVLRILTALEERLGSLGPKVIDLLAQALALEKKEANRSETLLDNDINCVLFETIKEKLKGQLLTGLVEPLQERAFKKAIKKIASLIHLAGQRKKQKEKMGPKMKVFSVAGGASIDRAAIAKQIANALIAQGKTDVTQAELEQLINVVVGMAEVSKNTNKPMTTANFLEQLTGGLSVTTDSSAQEKTTSKKRIDDLDKLVEPLTPSPGKNSLKDMENLSDNDLQTLLQNFKDLSTEEQHNLINYLKKLEYQEPERVEKLRGFVNLESAAKDEDGTNNKSKSDRESPFVNRPSRLNPISEDLVQIESEDDMDNEMATENVEEVKTKIRVDSEEEDYSFEDVVKTASKNVKERKKEIDKKIEEDSIKKKEVDLANAKDLISNLMSNITKRNEGSKGIDLLGLGTTTDTSLSTATPAAVIPASTADFAKTLSNISLDNLANIVSTVKHMTAENAEKKLTLDSQEKMNFDPPLSTNRLNFDPAQLDKTGMGTGRADSFEQPSFLSRGPMSFDRNSGPEPPFASFNADSPARSLLGQGPELPFRGPEAPVFRGEVPTLRDEATAFRNEAPAFRNEAPAFRNEAPAFRNDPFGKDISSFRNESTGFRFEAPNYRNDSTTFRNEADSFRNEAPSFRNEAPPFRNEAPSLRNEAPSFRNEAQTFKDDGQLYRDEKSSFRDVSSSLRDEVSSFRDTVSSFRSDGASFMDRGVPRTSMVRAPGPIGGLPPPFGKKDGDGPRGPNPNFVGPFGSRDRPSPFANTLPFSNFQPTLNQYPNNNPRGPRLNLIDRNNRLGNRNDFNNGNNYGRW